jgi:hypothetical protein
MGTINYKTSDFITIGYNCNNIDYDDDLSNDYYDQAATTRARYNFYYFHVSVEPGYYEGFSIDIEHNFAYCYDNYNEKRAALKEITQIKKFLLECINDFECVAVYPGWCTGYADYKTTLKELDAAIEEMRATVKNTPTWATLPNGEKFA